MSTIPKRITARELLTTVPVKHGADRDEPLFPAIKDIPAITKAADLTVSFPTLFSRCYSANGVPDHDLHHLVKRIVENYASVQPLLPHITPADIVSALDDAFFRVGSPTVSVVDDALGQLDMNDHTKWQRVVLLSANQDALTQPIVRQAIFQNLVDAGRKRPTVDLRVLLDSSVKTQAYKDTLLGSVWYELCELAPTITRPEVEGLYKKVSDAGHLTIDVRGAGLGKDLDHFAVAFFIGLEETIVTNLTTAHLPTDPDALDLWERIAKDLGELGTQSELKSSGPQGHPKKGKMAVRHIPLGMPA